jgi:hypothetical protein
LEQQFSCSREFGSVGLDLAMAVVNERSEQSVYEARSTPEPLSADHPHHAQPNIVVGGDAEQSAAPDPHLSDH